MASADKPLPVNDFQAVLGNSRKSSRIGWHLAPGTSRRPLAPSTEPPNIKALLRSVAVCAPGANVVLRDLPVAVSPAWIAGPDAPSRRLSVGGVIVVLIVASP